MSDFIFRKMPVYRLARAFAAEADTLAAALPPHRRRAGDQLTGCSLSIMLNIAEGSGELRPLEKARFYRMARRSCYEAAAIIDHLTHVAFITPHQQQQHDRALIRLSFELTHLAASMTRRPAS